MNIFPQFFRSLLLTSVFSFATPLVLVGGLWVGLSFISCIPGLGMICQSVAESIQLFLATFGTGSPIEGILVIGSACATVGALFDTYAFYRYQALR